MSRGGLILRSLLIGACLAAPGGAGAAPADPPSDQPIRHGRDIPQVVVYGWERNGKFINAVPGDGQDVPYDAAKVHLRRFVFPGADLRELFFEKGVRTHPHENFWDTIYYTISGRRVHFVNDLAAVNEAGDVALHPTGVNHHGEAVVDSTNVEIAITAPKGPNPNATWIRNRDVPSSKLASWVAGGHRVTQVDDGTAPPGAIRFTAKIFALPGYTLREVRLPRGAAFAPATATENIVMYVVKGRLKVAVGRQKDEVIGGDALRQVPGQVFGAEALEDTLYFDIAVPAAAK